MLSLAFVKFNTLINTRKRSLLVESDQQIGKWNLLVISQSPLLGHRGQTVLAEGASDRWDANNHSGNMTWPYLGSIFNFLAAYFGGSCWN